MVQLAHVIYMVQYHERNLIDVRLQLKLFQDVTLDDDTLLNKPQLTDTDNNIQDKLTCYHLAAILAVWLVQMTS